MLNCTRHTSEWLSRVDTQQPPIKLKFQGNKDQFLFNYNNNNDNNDNDNNNNNNNFINVSGKMAVSH